ncbi:MAG TPA: serine/threonine-protein kinase [Aggregatilineaceae bacterium]|nr:serine/threonine-protein kinase [Aggregatilineaceae bacterium]
MIDAIERLAGRTLGQYELRTIIGTGGMGVVYQAHQPSLRRDVAIKLMSPALSNQQGYIDQFLTEARTAAALEHPHIVPVYDSGVYEQLVYVVMRLLPGGSLSQRMAARIANQQPPYPLAEIASLLKVVAGALDYAHSQGVIHRDIKASNILFDKHDNLFLTDFGIARALPHSVISTTQHDGASGTPLYMSPEQWRDEILTPASDQYALGVVVYYLVTGRMPFDAATPYALMYQHINEAPTPLERWRADVPEALGDVMERVLAKIPNERFASATAFAQAFEQALRQKPQPQAMWDPDDMEKTNIIGQPRPVPPPNYQQPPRYNQPPMMPPGPPAYNPPRTSYIPLPQRRFNGKWIVLAGLAVVMLIAGGDWAGG